VSERVRDKKEFLLVSFYLLLVSRQGSRELLGFILKMRQFADPDAGGASLILCCREHALRILYTVFGNSARLLQT
jgi:hypothetical protein